MNIYSIAGLRVALSPVYDRLRNNAEKFLCPHGGTDTDLSAVLTPEEIAGLQAQNSHLSLPSCEYIFTGSMFYTALLEKDGLVLHSSAVELEGKAYLFSAKSGTGKSTHAGFWVKRFGAAVKPINDDKPALRLINGRFFACGTPWSGKTDINSTSIVPVQAIAFLERGEPAAERISPQTALPLLLAQTVRPTVRAEKLLSLLDRLTRDIPIYRLTADMSERAAEFAHGAMSGKNT